MSPAESVGPEAERGRVCGAQWPSTDESVGDIRV